MSINDNANIIAMNNWRLQPSAIKKCLLVTLTAAALTLSACGKQDDEMPMEGSALEIDSETSEQEAAAEIAESNAPMISDREENPVLPSSDQPEGTGSIVGTQAEPDKDITGDLGGGMSTDMADNNVGTDIDTVNDSESLDDSTVESQ